MEKEAMREASPAAWFPQLTPNLPLRPEKVPPNPSSDPTQKRQKPSLTFHKVFVPYPI